jgi:Protein of unknown function (DUF3606)
MTAKAMTNTPDELLNEFLDRYDEFLISLQSELVQHGEKTRYWHEMWIERVRDALDNKLAPCPLCGSPAEEHHEPKYGLKGEAISCSNDKCILHISYQSETGKYVSRSQWKKVQPSVSETREKIADDKAKKVVDYNCVDLREPYELAYWSRRFGVSREQMAEAIQKVGTNAEDVAIALDNMADRKINHSSRMKGGMVAALGLCVLMIAFTLLVWHP